MLGFGLRIVVNRNRTRPPYPANFIGLPHPANLTDLCLLTSARPGAIDGRSSDPTNRSERPTHQINPVNLDPVVPSQKVIGLSVL